ncbi:MAG: hypothetical protein KDI39_14740, partial [Pseudomonadales bacterium]|nr:hypothetical protein [Pseudomonadales bacterium]
RAFAHTSAPTQVAGHVMTDNGLQQTIHGKGATITQFPENKLPIVSNLVQQVGSQQQAEHAKAVEHTQQTGAALAHATQNLQRQLTSNGSSLNQTTTNGDNVTNSNGATTSDTATTVNQAARDWLSQNQHSDATIRKLAADWKVGTSFQSNEQFIGKLAAYITGGKIEASAGVSGGISGTTTNADIQQLSERFNTSETLQHALTKQATQQIAQLNNQSTTGSIEQRETLEKSLANMRTASDQHSSALSESERISQSILSFRGMSNETKTSLTGVINKRIMEEMGETGRYEAVAAFNNGDMNNENLKRMMKIAHEVVAEQGIASVNVKQHEAEIRADAAKGQSEILAQKPSSVPSNGTKQQVLKMQENHEQAKDVTETFIGFAGVDLKNKQDGILDEAKRINQDVSNQVGVTRPDVRHADSGLTVGSNVVTDLMDKIQNVGVEKK